jgi:uncharacterized membrane protein
VVLEIGSESPTVLRVAAAAVLYLHISAGLVALVAGTGAIIARKGSRAHRLSGKVFIVSMLIMASIGAAVSPFLKPAQWVNVVAGVFTLYLVVSAWLTVKSAKPAPVTDIATFVVSIAILSAALSIGFASLDASSNEPRNPGAAFVFAGVVALAALGDVRIILRGGSSRVQRIVRHLWRMCYALLIATASLFMGQPQVFSPVLRESGLLFVPVLAVFVSMIFWLVRVRFTNKHASLSSAES